MIIVELSAYIRTKCRDVYRYQLRDRVYCPDCGQRLYAHGTCTRKVLRPRGGEAVVEVLALQVMECRACRRTHRVLPGDVLPYKHYDVHECVQRCVDRGRAGDMAYYRLIAWLTTILAAAGEARGVHELVARLDIASLVERVQAGVRAVLCSRRRKSSILL